VPTLKLTSHLFSLLFSVTLLAAPTAKGTETLAEAEKLYAEGQFEKSRQQFKSALAENSDRGAAFFYNYGTAALQAGSIGESFVALQRASLSAPLDGDIQDNFRRSAASLPAAAKSVQPLSWFSWWPGALRAINWKVWLLISLLFLAPFLWLCRRKGEMSPIAGGNLVAALLFLSLAGLSAWQSRFLAGGIIAATKVMSGPAQTYPGISSLEAGALVNIEEKRDGWSKLRYRNANLQETVGWVESPSVLEFR